MAKKLNFFYEFYLNWILDIVASYHCMQIRGKRMILLLDLGRLDPKSGHRIFISKIWLRQSLYIMVSYHRVQYQKKLMIQS